MIAVARSKYRWPQPVLVLILIYCTVFLVNAPNWVPEILRNTATDIRSSLLRIIDSGVSAFANLKPAWELKSAIYFLFIAGLFPLLAGRVAGRSLRDLGWRRPNKLAVHFFLIALVVSTPFLVWMVRSPTIAGPYLKQLSRMGFFAFSAYYVVNMFTEHLLLHGIVLGLARRDGRWPEAQPLAPPQKGIIGILRWLGLATPRDVYAPSPISSWLGLAPGCIVPILFSALLFGMVHLGKDARELLLAFPGGLAQAFIAYRSNSWFTPFLIHLATASAALAMMKWM